MHSKTHELLIEALRRFECFAVPRDGRKWKLKDLQHTWTGLGTYTEYKKAIEEGYMTYANKPNPRHSQWWKLTEKGAQMLLEWHKAGYNKDNLPTYTPSAKAFR